MLMPNIFGENLFDDFFEYPLYTDTKVETNDLMKTDIKETEAGYEIITNLPGVKKENVMIEFKNGYLTVNVNADPAQKEENEKVKYICRERYTGACSRRFHVGNKITEKNIKAKFEDGTLKMFITRPEEKEETDRFITIEG